MVGHLLLETVRRLNPLVFKTIQQRMLEVRAPTIVIRPRSVLKPLDL
jgi:hypothetical protein